MLTAPHTLVPHTTVRKVIARRLTEAKQTVPHFYVSMDIELDALLKLRAELNARSAKDGPGAFKLSVNDLLIKAAAVTLRRIPKVNAAWTDEGVALFDDVDISVAVSIPDGLITPIVRQADRKGLAAISNEMKDLSARAKAGKLKPEEFQGGGFSISNMGMYGVSEFRRHHQPAAGRHPRRRRRPAAPGGEGRRARRRHGHDLHAQRRPPRDRRRARGGMAGRVQAHRGRPAEPDAVSGARHASAMPSRATRRWLRASSAHSRSTKTCCTKCAAPRPISAAPCSAKQPAPARCSPR